jgi:hypothetical protein
MRNRVMKPATVAKFKVGVAALRCRVCCTLTLPDWGTRSPQGFIVSLNEDIKHILKQEAEEAMVRDQLGLPACLTLDGGKRGWSNRWCGGRVGS